MTIRTCVFPVAGLGTRFLPATKSIAKEMLVVGDRPLIDYAVAEARASGIERFIFVTSAGKSAIEDYFDRNISLENWLKDRGKYKELEDISGTYLEAGQAMYVRQAVPLGLGHAVWCARQWIDDDAFAVVLADDFIFPTHNHDPCLAQLCKAYERSDGNMAAVMDVELGHVQRYGIMAPHERIGPKTRAFDVVEKPRPEEAPSRTAIIGRYILKKEVLGELDRMYHHEQRAPQEELQLTNALKAMLPNTSLTGFHFDGNRLDCGTKEGWLHANHLFHINQSSGG